MKSKLRKITIDNLVYLYIVTDKFHMENKTNTLTVKVYLPGNKQTPLIIDFLTLDHFSIGQLLNSGVKLKNCLKNTEEIVNLNEPKYIKEFILIGLEKGWTGTNRLEKQNGLNYLSELGFEITSLLP